MCHGLILFIHRLKAYHRILRHFLFWCGNCEWKARGAPRQTAVSRDWWKGRLKGQTKWQTDSNESCVLRLTLSCKFQTHCNSTSEKQFLLALGVWIHHCTGDHFIYPWWSKIEARPSEWPGRNIRSFEWQVRGEHHVASSGERGKDRDNFMDLSSASF